MLIAQTFWSCIDLQCPLMSRLVDGDCTGAWELRRSGELPSLSVPEITPRPARCVLPEASMKAAKQSIASRAANLKSPFSYCQFGCLFDSKHFNTTALSTC